jgi:REP element-mobilizing transposase RayT
MARTPRAVVVETPHHVVQRANGRQAVFFTDKDREEFGSTPLVWF